MHCQWFLVLSMTQIMTLYGYTYIPIFTLSLIDNKVGQSVGMIKNSTSTTSFRFVNGIWIVDITVAIFLPRTSIIAFFTLVSIAKGRPKCSQ